MTGQIEITLKRSWIAATPRQRENLRGLGLFRREVKILRADTPSIRGMIQKVLHLVDVRRAPTEPSKKFAGPWVEITPPAGEPAPEAAVKTPKTPAKRKAEAPKAKAEVSGSSEPKPAPTTKGTTNAAKAAPKKKEKKA
ncbi:MAG: 50S ribosomal protein L30 [Pseudomonadota bacterium]